MKKILALVLTLAMTMSLLAGCSSSSTSTDSTSTDSTSTDTASSSSTVADSSTSAGDNAVTDGSNIVEVDITEKPDGIVAGSLATYFVADDCVSTQIPNSYPGGRWQYSWLYDTLFYSPSGSWEDMTGLLVKDYSISDDALTWTMELYDTAYFQNGNPVDADAVVACWDYYVETAGITNFVDYGTDGDYTVWVTMTAPNAEFMQQMAIEHVSIFDVTAYNENVASGMDAMEAFVGIGSGPYYMSAWELGASMTFTANENYWCEERYPAIETVYVPVVSDTATQQTMLQSGDADAGIIFDWTVMENLVDNYGLTYVTEAGTYRTLWFNTSGYTDVLTIPEVRQALTMMVDMEEVSIALSGDYGAYGVNAINDGIDYTHNYVYDPEGGLELLASVGVDPSEIVIEALTDAAQSPIFSNIQAQLNACGVTLNFVAQDNAALMTQGMAGEWDLWAEHGGLCIGSYQTAIKNVLSSAAAQKVVLDPELSVVMADLVDEAFSQADLEDQFDVLEELCAVAAENYLYLGNVAVPTWLCTNDTIANFTLDKNGKFWCPWDSWVVS